MIISDSPTYREATLEQLQAYADYLGLEYETKMTTDLSQNKNTVWNIIRDYMLDYKRLKDIEVDIFIPGRLPVVGQLQTLLTYDQMADGLAPKISEAGLDMPDRNFDDSFNFMVMSGVGKYILDTIVAFNASMTSVSGLYWTYDNQDAIIPCTAQYFKYHQWGDAYDNETSGAFFYPSGTVNYPEGWDGIGLGVNTIPGSGDAINYFRRSAPSGSSYPYWKLSDILSTGWPDSTESNQSVRSATNSLIISLVPCSG